MCVTIDYLVELNQKLCGMVKYLIRMEPGIQTPEQTLTLCSGSCRDTFVAAGAGAAASGVGGAIRVGLSDSVEAGCEILDGPERHFGRFHRSACVGGSVFAGAGWIGLDPTSGLLTAEGHIPLACSADPVSAAAITGFCSFDDEDVVTADPEDGADHGDNADNIETDGFEFAMSVTRIHEDPRVTKPYTDEQWAEIEAAWASGRCRAEKRRRAPDHGRRADVCFHR